MTFVVVAFTFMSAGGEMVWADAVDCDSPEAARMHVESLERETDPRDVGAVQIWHGREPVATWTYADYNSRRKNGEWT